MAESWAEGGTDRILLHIAGGALVGGLGGGSVGTAVQGPAAAGLASKMADQLNQISKGVGSATGSELLGNLTANVVAGIGGALVGGGAGATTASNVQLYNQGNDKNETEARKQAQELRKQLDKERAMLGQAGAKVPQGVQAATVPSSALAAGAAAATNNAPLALGSTGRATPNSLQEQLALQQAMSNPAAGVQLPIPLGDPRWPAADGWVKMSQNVNGVEIHYVRNVNSGAVDDFKFK